MVSVKKAQAAVETVKKGRGRPKGSKNKGSKVEKETLYTFRCSTCGWSIKSGIKTAMFFCPSNHRAAVQVK